ncbi:MAG: biopolymer transporter ExbD [bacterium]|nr:biopolymer transporter ExbD [bacterium]
MATIPTAGMADIAFLLLIFFMVIVYDADRTRVDLPDSSSRSGTDAEAATVVLTYGEVHPTEVVIRFTDGIAESRVLPDVDAVRVEAEAALAANPQRVFKIKADRLVPARDVTRVFDALTGAGGKQVLMLTDEKEAR